MATLDPGQIVGDVQRAAGRLGIDTAAEVAELGVVFGVGTGLLGTGPGEAGQQRRGPIRRRHQQIRPLPQLPLVNPQREVVQQVVGNRVVAAETPVADLAELLKRFGKGTGDRSGQRIAIEVLPAEHSVDAKLVGEKMVAFDRVDALPSAGRPGAIVANPSVVENHIGTIGFRQVLENLPGHRADAVRADHVRDAVAGQGPPVVGVSDDVAARVHRIVQRDHRAVGIGVAAEVAVAELRDGQRLQAAAAIVLGA